MWECCVHKGFIVYLSSVASITYTFHWNEWGSINKWELCVHIHSSILSLLATLAAMVQPLPMGWSKPKEPPMGLLMSVLAILHSPTHFMWPEVEVRIWQWRSRSSPSPHLAMPSLATQAVQNATNLPHSNKGLLPSLAVPYNTFATPNAHGTRIPGAL